MGNLSHIDEIEARDAARDEEEMRAAQQMLRAGRTSDARSSREPEERGGAEVRDGSETPTSREFVVEASAARDEADAAHLSADQEAEFHGLSSVESMGIGQKFLIILAALVVIGAILYVLND